MFSFSLPRLAAAALALVCAGRAAVALPVDTGLGTEARDILSRSTKATAAPHFVIYSDKWVSGSTGPPDASDLKVSK